MSRLLARFTAWLTRRANFRYALVAERPDGVWEELVRLPAWFLRVAGDPYYPDGWTESDRRYVRLDAPEPPPGRRSHGKALVLVDTKPHLPRRRSWTEDGDDDDE